MNIIKKIKFLLVAFLFIGCEAQEVPEVFSEAALNDKFVTLDGKDVAFRDILSSYKGQTVLIDVWASWCRDCIEGLPELKAIQKEYNDVVFLFLSLDKGMKRWKQGIEKYQIKGEHYYMESGWDGDFGEFLDLDWIPRYLVIDKEGKITLFKAVKITDNYIIKALQ